MADSFPRPFGKYILVRPLAMGRMGEVHLALAGEIGGLEKLCVIKKVSASSAAEDTNLRQFLEQAKVTVKLNHSNLVQVFDVGAVDGEHYLAMEYVEGQNLCEVLDRCVETRNTLPPAAALYLAMQICRGLQYAHTYGELQLVHRDLCPANVLVSYFGEVKVAGFGMSYAMSAESGAERLTVYGRPSYLAPEQLDATASPDRRTDVYTVGILLWEMLVGRPMRPEVRTSAEALKVIRQAIVTPPSAKNGRLPPQLDPLVVKALQPRLEHRFSSAEALRKAIAKALAQIDPTFESSQMAEIMRSLYRRRIEGVREERERLLAADFQHLRATPGKGKGTLTGPRRPGESSVPGVEVDLSGQRISDRYRAIRLIGEGGMGAVYEGEHLEIGRRVAIKVLHAAYSRDTEAVRRFREEARAATRIGHPNIIEVTDSGVTDDGRFFFVMELLSGIDLANVMAEQRTLPVDRCLHIVLQICAALHAAHEAGVIHRDLKPENIFLSQRNGTSDFVTLLDFGIAKNVELAKAGEARLTMPGIAIGTPEYMAPEQAAGEEIDRRIDVYATATMLYEMLTGHLPYEAQNLMQLLNKKASEPPVPPSRYLAEIGGELEQTILRALVAEREQRTATMAELGGALERYQQHRLAHDPTVRIETGEALPASEAIATSRTGTESTERSGEPAVASMSDASETAAVASGVLVLAGTGKDRQPALRSTRWMGWIAAAAVVSGLGLGVVLWGMDGSNVADRQQRRDAAVAGAGGDRGDAAGLVGSPDSGGDDGAGAIDVGQQRMTVQEMSRLLEWAKRAADGRRYLRPKGDNVHELLQRIEVDYPDHPQVRAFRRWLGRQLGSRARWAVQRRSYAVAERVFRAWIVLQADDDRPRRRLATLLLSQGQRALKRRGFKTARKHALEAQQVLPESAGPLILLGDIALRQGRSAIAAKHYKEALKTPQVGRGQQRLLRARLARLRR